MCGIGCIEIIDQVIELSTFDHELGVEVHATNDGDVSRRVLSLGTQLTARLTSRLIGTYTRSLRMTRYVLFVPIIDLV